MIPKISKNTQIKMKPRRSLAESAEALTGNPPSLRPFRRSFEGSALRIELFHNKGFLRRRIQTRLLDWFSKNKRPMPWRMIESPYRTFVSEIMLQQTQIKTVIPYFERWMKAFPDIKTLADSTMDRILKLWEGLGYYTRARNLHKASKLIVEKHGGKIPDNYESLIALPGIGRYTAGAIASIAFQKPVPLVDGNVSRVLSRIFNIHQDILKPATQKLFYEIASKIVPKKNPGDFNQSLMELGSLVCFPVMPNCASCPLKSCCLAYKKGNQESLPVKSKAPRKKQVQMAAALILNGNKILIRRRPPKGIWGGLWEIPSVVSENKNSFQQSIERYMENEYKMKMELVQKETLITHHLTHLKMTIQPFTFKTNKTSVNSQNRWADVFEINQFSFPVPYQNLLALTVARCKKD